TRQAQVREARDDTLLPRRQRHEGIARREHIVHGQQNLAVASDCESIDRRKPWLFNAMSVHIVWHALGSRDAAEQLVDEAEVALEKPRERYLTTVEMREIDSATECAPPLVLGMLKYAAADHRNFGRWIEDCQVNGDFREVERRLVFGIQEA